jgi:serine/threonine-protein kinase
MADVYRAEAPGPAGFRKEVAIKVIRPGFGGRSEFVRMFINEAQLASRLNHANIVQVFDFDQVEGRYYIAMEFVRGRTLLEIMDACRERGLWLDLPQSLHICAQVASALSYAHRLTDAGRPLSLVHRDVSPQNVLVSFEGEVKLADFGIAHAMGASAMTAPGIVKGKLAYMAPEQARAERVDPRADVFALGVVAWELCTGNDLFARDSDAASLAAVLGPQPVIAPPSNWNPKVSPELDLAIMAALERDRERRTGSAEELATQLSEVLLRVVRSSAETDLRKLMRRLWPEGSDSVVPARVPLQPTAELAPEWRPATPPPAAPPATEASPAVAVTTMVLPNPRPAPAPVNAQERKRSSRPGVSGQVGEPIRERKRPEAPAPGRSGGAWVVAGAAALAAISAVVWMVVVRRAQAPAEGRPVVEAQRVEAGPVAPVQIVPTVTAPAPTAPPTPVPVVKTVSASGAVGPAHAVQPAVVTAPGSTKAPDGKQSGEDHAATVSETPGGKKRKVGPPVVGGKRDTAVSSVEKKPPVEAGGDWVAYLDAQVPANATVYLNDRLLGTGSARYKLVPGSHRLTVEVNGVKTEEEIKLSSGKTRVFKLKAKD